MMGSMYSAASGLKNHQLFMDAVGNNIANVNTLGYKGSRVIFQDVLSRTLREGRGGTAGEGGVDPIQVGLGAGVASTGTDFGQGILQATGKATDMSLQGDGMFVLSDGSTNYYSRAGAFDLDSQGRLVDPSTGMLVQGWKADAAGNVDTAGALGALAVPLGQTATASPSTGISLGGNLDANAANAATANVKVGVYDSLGNRHDITLTFTKGANNQWSWTAAADPADTGVTAVTATPASTGFTFAADGSFDTANNPTQWDPATGKPLSSINVTFANGAAAQDISIDLSALTQLANTGDQTGTGNITAAQDGKAQGTMSSLMVNPDGRVVGVYSNGTSKVLGQLAVATFANPAGLSRVGNTMFSTTAASGNADIGTADSGGRGQISAGYLEQSNVDLAQQFTNLIMAERGFQANSRVITATDEMLQDLVNLKR